MVFLIESLCKSSFFVERIDFSCDASRIKISKRGNEIDMILENFSLDPAKIILSIIEGKAKEVSSKAAPNLTIEVVSRLIRNLITMLISEGCEVYSYTNEHGIIEKILVGSKLTETHAKESFVEIAEELNIYDWFVSGPTYMPMY